MSGLVLPPPPCWPAQPPIGRAALFLDFDGTLVDLAVRPDAVLVPAGLPDLLVRVATGLEGALAVVSGRNCNELHHFLPIDVVKVGGHGAAFLPAPIPPVPRRWLRLAVGFAARTQGLLLEQKPHGFVFHYRQAPGAGPDVRRFLTGLLAGHAGFELMAAHMAWEIRPRGASKGRVVQVLMQTPPFASRKPVFIGDDVTDEEGMAAARALGGHGWRLQEAFGTPDALRAWLLATLEAA